MGKRKKNAAAVAIGRFCEQSQKQAEGSGSDSAAPNFRLGFCRRRPGKRATLKASLREAMEAKRLVEEKTAMLRKKMIAMKECEKKLQKDKSVDSSNMMIPDKQYEHMRNMMPNSHFPEALTGELLAPLGFPQVQDASDDEIFGPIS